MAAKPASRTITKNAGVIYTQTHEWELEGFQRFNEFKTFEDLLFGLITEPFALKANEDASIYHCWQLKIVRELPPNPFGSFLRCQVALLSTPIKSMRVQVGCYIFQNDQFCFCDAARFDLVAGVGANGMDELKSGDAGCERGGVIQGVSEARRSLTTSALPAASPVDSQDIKCSLRISDFEHFLINLNNGRLRMQFRFDHFFETQPDHIVMSYPISSAGVLFTNPCSTFMGELLKNKRLSDFDVFSSDGERFQVHKIVLAAQSPVFERMFEVEMREASESKLDIVDFAAGSVGCFLEYLYCQNVQEKCPNLAEELLCLAEKYQVTKLKRDAELHLCSQVCAESACQLLVLADLNNATKLKKTCIDLIIQNRVMVSGQEAWKTLRRDHQLIFQKLADAMFAAPAEAK